LTQEAVCTFSFRERGVGGADKCLRILVLNFDQSCSARLFFLSNDGSVFEQNRVSRGAFRLGFRRGDAA
jgi:hypothetical protein